MGRINILDSSVFNMIAAGEVVERPASVVKELVENSIDAGASEVNIYIEEGGIRRIQVTDNGTGIFKEDLTPAVLPHATSKLKNITDLDTLSTLGFRGEALASISSVSEFSISSKPENQEIGAKIIVSGGKIIDIIDEQRQNGTQITVDNLFFTTPARLKFLKKPINEKHAVIDMVQSLILSNPYVTITLSDEEGEIINNQASNLLDAIYSVYDAKLASNLLPIILDDSKLIKVSGFVSKIDYSKPTRGMQTIIVNGRPVVDQTITTAVERAYQDYLMKRQYPVFILDILIPFEDVDANVHPAKTEVRFRDKNLVFSAVFHAVQNTLLESLAQVKINNDNNFNVNDIIVNEPIDKSIESQEVIKDNKFQDIFTKSYEPKVEYEQSKINTASLYSIKFDSIKEEPSKIENNSIELFDGKIVGQIFDTYIILEQDEKVYLIDQHAAHERILYDRIVNNFCVEYSQPLLIPFKLDTTSEEAEYLDKIYPELKKFGFEIENNGLTYFINAVPECISRINFGKFFGELFKNILSDGEIKLTEVLKEKLCQQACKAAIKGGESLNREQLNRVVKTFLKENGSLPTQCPHGRPAVIALTKEDLEKLFKRIV